MKHEQQPPNQPRQTQNQWERQNAQESELFSYIGSWRSHYCIWKCSKIMSEIGDHTPHYYNIAVRWLYFKFTYPKRYREISSKCLNKDKSTLSSPSCFRSPPPTDERSWCTPTRSLPTDTATGKRLARTDWRYFGFFVYRKLFLILFLFQPLNIVSLWSVWTINANYCLEF